MKREAKILLQASFAALFAVGLLGPIYAIFVQNIGGDILDAGFSYAIFSLVMGIFILLFGTRDFFSRNVRTMVIIGYCLLTIGEAGYLFVQTPVHLFVVQIIIGLAGGILEPSWDAVFGANQSEQQLSRIWSFWTGGNGIITGISALVGSLIVSKYSFTHLFALMLIFNVGAVTLSLQLLKKK